MAWIECCQHLLQYLPRSWLKTMLPASSLWSWLLVELWSSLEATSLRSRRATLLNPSCWPPPPPEIQQLVMRTSRMILIISRITMMVITSPPSVVGTSPVTRPGTIELLELSLARRYVWELWVEKTWYISPIKDSSPSPSCRDMESPGPDMEGRPCSILSASPPCLCWGDPPDRTRRWPDLQVVEAPRALAARAAVWVGLGGPCKDQQLL